MANKKTLTKAVAEAIGKTQKDSAEVVDVILNSIKGALEQGETVKLVGFGSFNVIQREARKGRNPQTGEELQIPAKKVVKFKPGASLADGVNS
jgi:DNA-binding protein HU-beta